MRLRESISNLIALALLLGGAALVFVWLADTMMPEPEPAAGAALRQGEVSMTAQALMTPMATVTLTEVLPTPTPPVTLPLATPTRRAFAEPPLFTPTPWSLNPERLTISPLYPGPDEAIVVEVRGSAPSDCHPAFIGYEVAETGYIPVALAAPAGVPCTEPPSPWSATFTVDPLPPGHWILEIYLAAGDSNERIAAHTIYMAPPGPTPVVTPTTVGDFPTPTPYAYLPEYLTVSPAQPTAGASILVEVSGLWGNGCVPRLTGHRLEGRVILLDLDGRPAPDVACAAVNTPWSHVVEIGVLPAGTYQVVAYIDEGSGSTVYAGNTFSVIP
jgi:hypothetical protein